MTNPSHPATALRRAATVGTTALLGAPAVATMALLSMTAGPAAAGTTLVVDTLDDGAVLTGHCTTPVAGECSLRDAISAASDGDTITFAAGLSGTITATQGQFNVDQDVTIVGPGADVLTIHADTASRVFYVGPNAIDVTIEGLTITGGAPRDVGGGIWANANGMTIIRNCVITGNDSGGANGGGIYVGLDANGLAVLDSTISDNRTAASGGGIAVERTSVRYISTLNSTITGNSAAAGGAMAFYSWDRVSVIMSTVTANTATGPFPGGLLAVLDDGAQPGGDAGFIDVLSSILTNNTTNGGTFADLDVIGRFEPLVHLDHSLWGSALPAYSAVGAIQSFTPGLGPLRNNGGRTPTMALLPGSIAIDAGRDDEYPLDTIEFDQRGAGFARYVNGLSDIGAFEVQPVPPEPPTTTTTTTSTTAPAEDEAAPRFTG